MFLCFDMLTPWNWISTWIHCTCCESIYRGWVLNAQKTDFQWNIPWSFKREHIFYCYCLQLISWWSVWGCRRSFQQISLTASPALTALKIKTLSHLCSSAVAQESNTAAALDGRLWSPLWRDFKNAPFCTSKCCWIFSFPFVLEFCSWGGKELQVFLFLNLKVTLSGMWRKNI